MILLLTALAAAATFSDVLPILERRCVGCHRSGEIAPQSFETYKQARPWAKAMKEAVLQKKMPPWFAVEGVFRNDPTLTDAEKRTIADWVDGGAQQGTAMAIGSEAHPTLAAADLVLEAPVPVAIPAKGDLPYQYVILPGAFAADRWLQRIAVAPSERRAVHHLVVYARPAGSQWLKGYPARRFFTVDAAEGATQVDILAVYTPGSGPLELPEKMAKKIAAGSDVVLQIHYSAFGKAAMDRPKVSFWFAKETPEWNVLTLQLNKLDIRIPPNERSHREQVSGTMPADALLLGFLPHMHLRGKSFTYRLVESGGRVRTLLRVEPYHFYWQLEYWLKTPLPLKKGARLQAEAEYDNSANNPLNPDPSAEVTYCEPSTCEMLVGFFEVAVKADIDKETFFRLRGR